MDGSAAPFIYLIQEAGLKQLTAPRRYMKITRPISLSRGDKPKQLLNVVRGKSLLQLSYERLRGLLPPERIFVCTGAVHAQAVLANLPELPKDQLYWRLDFLSGALTYAMADFGMIKRPSGVGESAHRERAARELIRFAVAGFTS